MLRRRARPILLAAVAAFCAAARAATPSVVAGPDYTLALSKDGKVFAWGRDARGQLGSGRTLVATTPQRVVAIPPVVHVDGGATHVAAVDWLGNVWTWGDDSAGQLGPRDTGEWTRPGRVTGLAGATRVAASPGFTAALRSTGDVVVWGTFAGQRRTPQVVENLADVVDLRSGDGHIVALRADGTVWAAGTNAFGELGDGTTGAGRARAERVAGLSNIVKIGAGACGSLALTTTGTVYAWGRATCATAVVRNTPQQVIGLADVLDVSGGRDFSHAVLANGTLVRWDNAFTPTPRPGFLAVSEVLAPIGVETIARLANDTVVVSGDNHLGQHAQGHVDPIAGVSLVASLVGVSGIATVQSPAGGATHYARRSNGDLYAWGSNFEGELGTNDALVQGFPRRVTGLPAIDRVAAGERTAYAVDTTGDVWAWGDNELYQVGDGTRTPRAAPVKVASITGVKDVAAGNGFAIFLMADGTVRKLGDPLTAPPYSPPAAVPGLANMASIAARGLNAFAVRTDGAAFGWGFGQDGLVGDGAGVDRAAPVAIAAFDSPVSQISVGRRHALARTADGAAWSWGTDAGDGVLGDGLAGAHQRPAPARVAGLAGVTRVAAGYAHSLAAVALGEIRSWGALALGDGPVASRNVPGPVRTLTGIAGIAAGDFVAYAVGSDGATYAWGGGAMRTTAQSTPGSTAGDGAFVHRATPVLVLREDAAGNRDAGDWFLDLDATVANAPPAALLPEVVPVARAALAGGSVSLAAQVNYRSTHYARKLNTYIVGYVQPAFLGKVTAAMDGGAVDATLKAGAPVMVELTPVGWTTVESHLVGHAQLAPAGNGALVDILQNVDAVALAGARFCVGYGEDAAAMFSSGTLTEVLAIEGSLAAPSEIPCTPPGIYVDGNTGSVLGTSAAFKATVVGTAPTGTLQFKDGFLNLATPATLSGGARSAQASITVSGLPFGIHSIGASYAGDAQNAARTVSLPMLHTVSSPPGGGAVWLSGPASAIYGNESIFTAFVTGNRPTGTIQFYDGGTLLGAPVPLVGGIATLRANALSLGPHTLAASYSGDASNSPRVSSQFAHLVASSLTKLKFELSNSAPMLATPLTLTATVTGNAPQGSMRFLDHGLDFVSPVAMGDPISFTEGRAELKYATFAAGSHWVSVAYSGDSSNPPVATPPIVVNVKLAVDPAAASADADGDGIPNSIELTESRNPVAKDNDIFGVARLFAMQQYRDFLGREGDATGVTYWTGQLNARTQDRGQMVETFFNSAEFQGRIAPVVRLYFAYFLRVPDYDGLNYWIGQYRQGNLNAISDAFATSAEFIGAYGSLNNSRFIDRVYVNVLGRSADNAGLNYWLAELNANRVTRGQIMVAFSESPEYRAIIGNEVYVTMMYMGMLRRAPDATGFSFWVSYRDQGKSGLDLINGFLASTEYRNRFLP